MKFVYTDHAKEKIADRKIPKRIIENALKNPDVILDSRFGRKIVHKLIKDRKIWGGKMRITYDPKADAMNIKFQEGKYEISKEIAEGIIIHYTKKG